MVLGWKVKAGGGFFVEIDLNQNGCVVADNPGIMAGFDANDGRSFEVEAAAVPVFASNVAPRQKPHVGVHAPLGTDHRLQMGRPAIARRVDYPLHPCVPRSHRIDCDPADLAVGRAGDRGYEWIWVRVTHGAILTHLAPDVDCGRRRRVPMAKEPPEDRDGDWIVGRSSYFVIK